MTDFPDRRIYLNGEYMALADANISVLDRGFLLGDSIYEVIPIFAGKPFRLKHHLQRMDNSLGSIRIENPHTPDEWKAIITELVSQYPDPDNNLDQSLYIHITRGISPIRDHVFPGPITPSVFVMSSPINYAKLPDPEKGISAVTIDDIRWKLCCIKATTLLPNVLARQAAAEQDAAEAIMIRDGLALEGAASNLFIVKDGVLITPPKGNELLPGITRDLVLELAENNTINYKEDSITLEDLQNADEIWLTSSVREIIPVTELDGKKLEGTHPGPLWRQMRGLYDQYKKDLRAGVVSAD